MMMNLRLAVADWPTRKDGEPATKPILAFVDAYGEVLTPCGDLDPKRVQLVRDWLDEAQRCIEGQQGLVGVPSPGVVRIGGEVVENVPSSGYIVPASQAE